MKKNMFVTAFVVVLVVIALAIPQGFAHGCDGSCSCGDCSCSQEDTCSSETVIKGDYPTVGFNFGPANQGVAPFTVYFTNTGDKGQAILWDFGDGSTETGETISHTYYTTGVFTVRQTISNHSTGLSNFVTEKITIVSPTEASAAETPVASSTEVVPQSIGARNSADSASTDGDGSPVIVGNSNTVTITINPPCTIEAEETQGGLFNAFIEAWQSFLQNLKKK